MAEFCKSCALDTWGPDIPSDFEGLAGEGNRASVICEGCGPIWVDNDGARIEPVDGTGYIDVVVDLLPVFAAALPSSYKIVGSLSNVTPGSVRLVVESSDLYGDVGQLSCEIQDAGSTRTVRIIKDALHYCGKCSAQLIRGKGEWICPECHKAKIAQGWQQTVCELWTVEEIEELLVEVTDGEPGTLSTEEQDDGSVEFDYWMGKTVLVRPDLTVLQWSTGPTAEGFASGPEADRLEKLLREAAGQHVNKK